MSDANAMQVRSEGSWVTFRERSQNAILSQLPFTESQSWSWRAQNRLGTVGKREKERERERERERVSEREREREHTSVHIHIN